MLSDTKGEISEEHVAKATDILRNKCLIGLTDHFNTTISRFQSYFRWPLLENKKPCLQRLVFDAPINQFSSGSKLEEGSEAWNIMLETNKYDLQLYENAKQIFREQESLFH